MYYILIKLTQSIFVMKRLFYIFLLAACSATQLNAQDPLYINVDPTCMDRYEYHINGVIKGIEYISYRVRQSSRDFVFLEIGSESISFQLSMPEGAKDCRNVLFSPDFIEKINTGQSIVYIVRKAEIGYNISQVNLASHLFFDGNSLKQKSYGLDFFCNLGHASASTNLAQEDSSSEIYYFGDAKDNCLKTYSFRRVSKETCRPNIDFEYIPQIGIVKEITRVSQMNDYETMLNLVRINDISIDTYKNRLCEGQTSNLHMPTEYAVETTDLSKLNNNEIVIDAKTYDLASIQTSNEVIPTSYESKSIVLQEKKVIPPSAEQLEAAKDKCALVSTKEKHIVQKGETLYGIAKKYSLSVVQLKEWNHLNDNTLATCLALNIVPPAVNKTAVNAVKSYEQPNIKLTEKGVSNEATSAEVKMHVVSAGENVYSLARKYGYTEERFRKMNGLSASDIIKVGQTLKASDCNCPVPKDYSAVSQRIKVSAVTKDNVDNLVAKGASTPKKEDEKRTFAVAFKRLTVHIVQEDETLQSIANRYNISLENLLTINELEASDILIPNQRIFVD